MIACQCEHVSHDENAPEHSYLAVAAGKHRAMHVGPICDRCALTHMNEYVEPPGLTLIPEQHRCKDWDLKGEGVPTVISAERSGPGVRLHCLACDNSWDERLPKAPKGWRFA